MIATRRLVDLWKERRGRVGNRWRNGGTACIPISSRGSVVGRWAFTFNVADLECAVRQNLPFVAIVADDQAWGITRVGQLQQFGVLIASSLGSDCVRRISGIARSTRREGVRAHEIARELRGAIEKPTVSVIHVRLTAS